MTLLVCFVKEINLKEIILMKNVISKLFSKFVMVVVYMLVGYTAFNLYLVLRDMVKAIYHICIGG